MKKIYFLFALFMIMETAWGQQKYIRCYSNEYLQEQVKQNPQRGEALEMLNRKVNEIVASKYASSIKGNPTVAGLRSNTVYIPVVVNVVYNTAAENISDAQVQSQVDVLNKDFSATNIEILNPGSYNFAGYLGIVANCKIQFCLYKIVRTQTSVISFRSNDAVKSTVRGGQDALNPESMLNIWSCNLGDGLLGYAQFPGGPLKKDGVVILYSALGTSAAGATAVPYDEGRTATHEIGHWLGLYHVFQNGCHGRNDQVDDTPVHDGPNFGCPSPGHLSTCKVQVIEQYMNYMDYTDDLCMYMFTNGQLDRIDGFIAESRAAYALPACPAAAPKEGFSTFKSNLQALQLPYEELLVFPTIIQQQTNLVIPSQMKGMGEILLVSSSGQVLRRQQVALTAGKTYIKLSLGNLSNGLFILKVKTPDGKIETRKLVVQH